LQRISADQSDFKIRGHGFFPGAKAPRVFWIGVEADTKLASLAAAVDESLATLNIPKEEHFFTPHLTLARSVRGSRAPRRTQKGAEARHLQRLQEKLAILPTPDFGAMTAREFFLYLSQPSPGGSKYTKLARFALY
jgi:2'-5' RNA ligase